MLNESNRLMTGRPGFFTTAFYVRYPSLLATSSLRRQSYTVAPLAIFRESLSLHCIASGIRKTNASHWEKILDTPIATTI